MQRLLRSPSNRPQRRVPIAHIFRRAVTTVTSVRVSFHPASGAGALWAVGIGLFLTLGLLASAPRGAGAAHPAAANPGPVVGVAAAPAAPTPEGRLSPCMGVVTSTLSPTSLQLCEELEVAANADPFCPVCPNGVNVVFVQIDKAFEAPWMDDQAVDALNELLRHREIPMKVGVVHYNSGLVKQRLRMTENIQQARGPLMEPPLGHDPFGDVIGAAREALRMLQGERSGTSRTGDERCEFIVFFASTKNIYEDQGRDMRDAANMIRREKVTLFVGCPETNDDYCTYTKEMPKTLANYTEAPEHGKLRRMVKGQMADLEQSDLRLRSLSLTQILPPELAYVPDSASVPPTDLVALDNGGTRLEWLLGRNVPIDPQTVTYKAKPLAEGTFAISGTMTLLDGDGKSRELIMPSVPVTVAGDCMTPTVPPTPTDTPTSPPTDTATPAPTNTPTEVPKPIYLPIALGEDCVLQYVRSDVALVIDLSTSMNRSTRPGGASKLAAAQAAAKRFVDIMDFTPDADGRLDRVAIVGFNRVGWIQQPLSNDAGALYAAIDALPERQAQYTRLDLALDYGAMAVEPSLRLPGNTPVIVLLTDGLPNQVPLAEDGRMETTVLRSAMAAKEAGVKIYTVGVGAPEDIDGPLLAECATSTDLYFYAPDANDLATIYSQIAYSFGCPRGRHNWQEPWP